MNDTVSRIGQQSLFYLFVLSTFITILTAKSIESRDRVDEIQCRYLHSSNQSR
jgi:hypothetical protein